MMAWLGAASAFLKRVPSWVYITLAAVALLWFAYHKGASDKDDEWIARLEKAEQQAKDEAEKATNAADEQAEARATAHKASQAAIRKAIEDAEATGGNALDSLVDSLR